jgi:uncharacterized membrane protein
MTDNDKSAEQADQQPAAEGDVIAAEGDKPVAGVVAAEADPHGASVVAAVGDEDGVQAVVAMDTDYFNTLLVADFANADAATAAYMTLLNAEIQGQLRIDGVITVHANEKGEINVDKMTEHSTKTGVKWGAAAGLAVGILFPPALIASVAGWGIAGGVLGKLRNLRHRSQASSELEGALQPNHSGIIALVHAVDVAKVKEQIPEATKVTTTEVDEATAKDIAESAKQVEGDEQPAS